MKVYELCETGQGASKCEFDGSYLVTVTYSDRPKKTRLACAEHVVERADDFVSAVLTNSARLTVARSEGYEVDEL